MFRKKTVFLLAFLVVNIFLITIHYLLTNLPGQEFEVITNSHIEDLISYEFNNLPDVYKRTKDDKDNRLTAFLENIDHADVKLQEINLRDLWNEANSWASKGQLVNLSSPNLGKLIFTLKNARIISADVDTRGTQLKLLLTLNGDQQVVFKPKWYDIEKVIEGPVYAGKDRYASEIIAFYLSILLGKPLTPVSVERKLSLKYDILPVATKRLLNTSFEKNNQTCVYGKCFYCKKEDPICETDGNLLGVVIFNIKKTFSNYRSPWQRTYKKGKKAPWQEHPQTYCETVRTKLNKRRIFDLIDTAIFDFIIQNGDRHHYETLDDTVVWIDNGKGLGNPYSHHLDVLAPLYQCCVLREKMWKTLQNLSGGKLTKTLKLMPDIQNLITDAHLEAMEERLLFIFATVEYCKKKKNYIS